MRPFIAFLAGLLLTAFITPLVIRFAMTCKCVDVPGGRRIHKGATPLWGGLAFFAGVLPALLAANSGRTLFPVIAASCIMVGIGMLDDRKHLHYTIKFGGMLVAASIVIFGGNAVVDHIGDYSSLGRVELGRFGIPFTYIGIIGVTNAINLLDGLNGLAGGVSLLAFLFMGIAALLAGNVQVAIVCFAFVGALAAFLRFNFPRASIFMGDAGSLFLGFSLSLTAIYLTQDVRYPVEPMLPVLVLFLPIFDAIRVMLVRLLNRKNPFWGDKSHLHYLIVRRTIPAPIAVAILWAVTATFGITALVMRDRPSLSSLLAVLCGAVILSVLTEVLVWRQKKYTRPAGGETRIRLLSPRGTFLL